MGRGRVAIAVENLDASAAEASPLRAGRYVSDRVADQGPGIAPWDLPRVFDPYFCTTWAGRGLGLAVCHSIVTRHGGLIAADSAPGKGAVVSFLLPAFDGATTPRPESHGTLEAESRRILVMDDDARVSAVLARVLRWLGHEVEVVSRGEEALASYREATGRGRAFAAVILNLTIVGGLGGLETLERLRELDPGVKAIVCSGSPDHPALADPSRHGFQGAIRKPFGLREVEEVLGEALGVSGRGSAPAGARALMVPRGNGCR